MDLIDELENFCDNALMHKREVIELAIRRFLATEKIKVRDVRSTKS